MTLKIFHAAAILASPALTMQGGFLCSLSILPLYLISSSVPPLAIWPPTEGSPPYEPVLLLLYGVLNLPLLLVRGQIVVFFKATRDILEHTN